jgi:DNA-binding GntR family transcriptional regulator
MALPQKDRTCIISLQMQEPSPKYQIIRESLSDAIASGKYQPGQRLPSCESNS